MRLEGDPQMSGSLYGKTAGTRSPSENCFLKGAAAIENRVVKTASQSSSYEARAMLVEGLPESSPYLYERPFLRSSIHSRAGVTSELNFFCIRREENTPTQ